MSKRNDWTDEDVEILRGLYGTVPLKEIVFSDHTPGSVYQKIIRLGLRPNRRKHNTWTHEHLEYLKSHYGAVSVVEIANALNRTMYNVYCKAHQLRLTTVGGALNMKGKTLPEDMFQRYLAGEGATPLAEEYGISWVTFARALDRRGIERRTVEDECRKRVPAMNELNRILHSDDEWCKRMSAKLQRVTLAEWVGFRQTRSKDRISLTPEWRAWRKAVYDRDGHRCVLCSKHKRQLKTPLEPHHILRRKDCPERTFDVNNGVTLCRTCHKSYVNNREKKYQAWFQWHVATRTLRLSLRRVA